MIASALLLVVLGLTALAPLFDLDHAAVDAIGQLYFPLFAWFAATFPDGRFVPRATVVLVAALAAAVAADQVLGGSLSSAPWWWVVPTVSGAALIAAQAWRYRRSATTLERERVRWVLLGIILSSSVFAVLAVIDDGVAATGPASEARASLAILPIVAGIVIGVTRPRLANVDTLLRATIVACAATLLVLPMFWAAWALTAALGASTVAAGWWWAAAVAAVAYPAVRAALWLADWIVFRGRPSPAAAAALLGHRLAPEPDPARVPQIITEVVATAIGSPEARIADADGGADADGAPIRSQGEVLGTLVAPPRAGESELTPRDRAVLAAIAVHAGPALSAARAAAELAGSHARLVLAREEERRRLRRDLHDDLSPTLAGIALGAAALSRTLAHTDVRASERANELHIDIRSAVQQLRDIAYGLRPSVLDDRGLAAAIRDRTAGARTDDRLRVEVVDHGLPAELPAAVDLAALRIVQEAVANVRRHAHATACRVELRADARSLRLTVDDDGYGLPASVVPGIGLSSIRERAAELGGAASFGRSADGGARVTVSLPLVGAVAETGQDER